MEEIRRQRPNLEKNSTKKNNNNKIKLSQVITMVVVLVIAVFVVIQVIHMVNYTLGNEMDVNKVWLYKWYLNMVK